MNPLCLARNGNCAQSRRFNSSFAAAVRLAYATLLLLGVLTSQALAQTKRLVVIKCDGLPYDFVDRFVRERDSRTGKSMLPWLDYIFYQNGAHLSNFYVRGMSLSAPSWSLLDTGQHLQIKGNVEFDRYTLHSYDYLNFLPFYLNGAVGAQVDMPAVEILDSLGVPLLVDAYPHNERYITFSLYQRGPRYSTLQNGLRNRFKKSPKELFDEWTMGFEMRNAVTDQLLRELIDKLADPKLRYLDLFIPDFDHIGHHNNDVESQLFVLKQMDATVGQVWTAIQKSPLAANTALAIVSDHGFNTDPKIYSQGYNLVKLLGSRVGGGHHVITKRRLLLDYAIKGVNPLVPLITTTTSDSYYLNRQSTDYPTAMLDFDGNERASIHLRDSDLNLLHVLLQQLQGDDLSTQMRNAVSDAFFATIDKRRADWQHDLEELESEMAALGRRIEVQRRLWQAQPKRFTKKEQEAGRDDDAGRVFVKLKRWEREQSEYGAYALSLRNLLSLAPGTFIPARMRIADVIPKDSMGDHNSIYQLQNYVVGIDSGGLVLKADHSLDMDRSFVHINYFSLLHGVTVRNSVQPGVSNRPVDITATRLSAKLVVPLLEDHDVGDDVIWIDAGTGKEALLLSRMNSRGELSLRYQPVSNLTQDETGRVHFELIPWQTGLPLKIFEDPDLAIPSADRSSWLSQWHTDTDWLLALCRTKYSNGLIGLNEELARHPTDALSTNEAGLSDDERLMRRFARRQRELVEADILVVANNHWNFDVRGFNPGGNHGSFFRISTHSIFMIAGGQDTKLPKGSTITEPYDSLSFVPTLLALTGDLRDDSSPVPILWEKGFRRFPGRVVKELLGNHPDNQKVADTGVSASP
jgi:Type I phosphodiesterase / nucleotide pyrophosphatase